MALRVDSTLDVLSWPSAYLRFGVCVSKLNWPGPAVCEWMGAGYAHSFCASMMTRTLSLVDAVDGGTPMSSRKLLAMVTA